MLIEAASLSQILKAKLSDYGQLIKIRLSFVVVFSASMAYLWAASRSVDSVTIWFLSAGGFFITGAANILNQIIERKSDKLMKRTSSRPIASGRINIQEAMVLTFILGLSGLFILSKINILCMLFGALAMLIYAGIYTPLKKITAFTIIPGAIAGSLPVVIGWIAARGEITKETVLLFLVQFIWQFPHTWSIAWLLNSEYNNARIRILPTGTKNKTSAILIMISAFLIIPVGLLLYMYESAGIHVTGILACAGIVVLVFAYKHYKIRTDKSAVRLMLSCLAYLPFILIILVLEKFL